MAPHPRIQGSKRSPALKAETTPSPVRLLMKAVKGAPGQQIAKVLVALEQLLPKRRAEVVKSIAGLNDAQRAHLTALTADGKTPRLAALLSGSPTVRVVSNAELRERVSDRAKVMKKQLHGVPLKRALRRLDELARKGVGAFDPVTGDVLIAIERVEGDDVAKVLGHELAHRRLHSCTPKSATPWSPRSPSSPIWPQLRGAVEADDPTLKGAPARLVTEVLAQVVAAPDATLAIAGAPHSRVRGARRCCEASAAART